MAWGRKKSGGRKEPQFGLGASLSELRLGPQDRVPSADDDEKPKKLPKRKTADDTDDTDDDAPRERKPRARRGRSKRRSRGRSRRGLFRLFYWGVVLGLWAAIGLVGVIVWVGAHLPPIQALEIPKRPPTIEIVGFHGSVLATRAAVANVLHRGVSQGGSTLTQQLAKNLFLTQERTLQRKLQEVELALWLERK